MQCGSLVVSQIKSLTATWITLLLLLGIHLYTNYAAVLAVRMQTFNRQRANIVLSHLADTGVILSPAEVAQRERIFEQDGALRWRQSRILGYGLIGVKLQNVLGLITQQNRLSGSWKDNLTDLDQWYECFENHAHLLWYDAKTQTAFIVLKREATTHDQLKAWAHGLLMSKYGGEQGLNAEGLDRLSSTLNSAQALLDAHTSDLEAAGWDVRTSALETRSGTRVQILHSHQ